ncbi:MAG: putative DNA binding domain-containing protein [Candidatus Latescibacteria bacterium]|nr:putative DNA binding domain-containing protein [Candidatus Latescibacterota bacterium]
MTTIEGLKTSLRQGESETVEFKETLDNEALESIAAFANTRGGMLFIGISDDATVWGITLGKETLQEWANHIAQATHLHPHMGSLPYEDKTVVIVAVSEGPLKPVPCRGRYFKRVGKSTRQMNDDDLARAVLEKVGMTWGSQTWASFHTPQPPDHRSSSKSSNHRNTLLRNLYEDH